MQQQTPTQSSSLPEKMAINSHSSTKIKPVITPYCREKPLNDLTAKQSSKPHVKNLKKTRFYQPDTRFAPSQYSLRAFTNTLKSQNSVSSLHYQIFSEFQFNTALFSKDLRGLSSLSSLKLEVREELIDATYVQPFMKTLASFKNLTHLDVSFYVYKTQRSPAFYDFLKSLFLLRKLTNLSLHIHMGRNALGGELELLSACLSRMTKLRSLKLVFDKSMETEDKNLITVLPSVLSKLTNLNHIELNLSGRTIQAPALLKFFMFLGTMKTLSSLNISFAFSNIVNKNNTEILTECLACLDPSVIRKLNFYVYQNTDTECLNKLAQALKKFTSLSLLHLNFYTCKSITDENITEISGMVKSLTSLESLDLTFPPLEIDTLFDTIVSALYCLQNLKSLKLMLARLGKISGRQIQQLFFSLKPSLEFLNINIHEPKSVVLEDNYEKLGENLKQLVHLKNLSLHFGGNNVIKNAEIESMIDAIKGLPSLSSWGLRLDGLENIDERTIEKLAEALRVLPSLSSVKFHLNQCKQLKEKEDSLLSLFSALKEKANIIDISLSIGYSKTNREQTSELWKLKDIFLVWC